MTSAQARYIAPIGMTCHDLAQWFQSFGVFFFGKGGGGGVNIDGVTGIGK